MKNLSRAFAIFVLFGISGALFSASLPFYSVQDVANWVERSGHISSGTGSLPGTASEGFRYTDISTITAPVDYLWASGAWRLVSGGSTGTVSGDYQPVASMADYQSVASMSGYLKTSSSEIISANGLRASGTVEITGYYPPTDTGSADVSIIRYSENLPPIFKMTRSKGSPVASAQLFLGDKLGGMRFFGNDGTELTEGANFYAQLEAHWSSTNRATGFRWSTTANGAASPSEKMILTGAGNLQVSGAISEGGTALSDKYMSISGGVVPGAIWVSELGSMTGDMPPRYNHSVVAHGGSIWVVGGFDGNNDDRMSDAWSSPDGANWTIATNTAAFGTRSAHALIEFKNKMWVIGGYDDSGLKRDVWSSSDGVTWTVATTTAAFLARAYHSALVYGGKMWVIGGMNPPSSDHSDVWSSSDGVTWTVATTTAAFGTRSHAGAAVFGGEMWIAGGGSSDIWSSSDGVTWTVATTTAAFGEQSDAGLHAVGTKLFLVGSGVWSSSNGIDWLIATSTPAFPSMSQAKTAVFANKIWITGCVWNGTAEISESNAYSTYRTWQ